MTIIQNIAEYESAKLAVTNHHMCAKFIDDGGKVIIQYPDGDFLVDGLRVDRNAVMLRRAIEIMDRHWTESFPGYRR